MGTIAHQLSIHHDVVERVRDRSGLPGAQIQQRPSIIDPFVPFIKETLTEYPDTCASRVYTMVRERGYTGGPDHFRHQIAELRPPRHVEAYPIVAWGLIPESNPGLVPASAEAPGRAPRAWRAQRAKTRVLATGGTDASRGRLAFPRRPSEQLMTNVDVFQCPRCHAHRMQRIAAIVDHDVVRRILRAVGLPTDPPTSHPPRSAEELYVD